MNERIKSMVAAYGDPDLQWNDAKVEKFAELIIRECAGIYSRIDNGNLHMGTDDYLEALTKHFGIE